MKKYLFLAAMILMGAANVNAASPKKKDKVTPEAKGVASINRATAEAHVEFLACDELEGREAGWKGGRIAGNYIISCLKQMGLQPLFEDGYVQPFEAYHAERQVRGKRWQVHPDSISQLKKGVHQKLDMRNILAKIEGKNPNEIVIIGAHYDHLGYDPMLNGDKIYNGADDNASGVQAVLQVARAFLATGEQPERTVIFAFWEGLLGSKHFALAYPEIGKVKGYLNYDMIGRNNNEAKPKHVVYFYTAAYQMFGDWLKNDIVTYNLELEPDYRAWDNPVGGSDNGTFAKLGIPIIWYHTDAHPDYHLPGDHADRCNWPKMVDITKASFLAFWKLANEKY
ncbi:MAG: M28 family peptidase [Planctomycetia bacterium]|nr:M28 family peptidase [Planctomycetia bacterium]